MNRIVFLLFFILPLKFIAQWNSLYSLSGTVVVPYNLDYTSDSAIFITSKDKFIFSKNDGALFNVTSTFTTVPTEVNYSYKEFLAISFDNKDTGLFGGNISIYPRQFCQSAIGAFSTWNLASPLTSSSPVSKIVSVKSANNGMMYAFDDKACFYKSIDNGITWQFVNSVSSITTNIGVDMFMINSDTVFFLANSKVYKTTNGGISVSVASNLPSAYNLPVKLSFVSSNIGYMLVKNSAGKTKVYKTINGGNNWNDVLPGLQNNSFVDLSFTSADTGFVIAGTFVINTFDGGGTWYIKRFTGKTLRKLEFINNTKGVLLTTSGSNLTEVYRYDNTNQSQYPYALFDCEFNYCCSGVACNFINYGSPTWNYNWYVNGTLSSSQHTPSSLTLPLDGNNTIKLVTSNGTYSDSITTIVYNAPYPFPSPTMSLYVPDTTICLGTSVIFQANNVNSQFNYFIYDGPNNITLATTINGSNKILTSNFLDATDTLLTLVAQTNYPSCPGNMFTKSQGLTINPLPPNNLLSLPVDSICPNDYAKVVIGPLTSTTSYTVNLTSNSSQIINATSGYDTLIFGPIVSSNYFTYNSKDIKNCNSLASVPLYLKVDSVLAQFASIIPSCFINDTLTVISQSMGTSYNWGFSLGTQVISNSDTAVQLKYSSIGDYLIDLMVSNQTGCADSINYKIGVFNHMLIGSGTVCFTDTTVFPSDMKRFSNPWFQHFYGFVNLHVDKSENYYLSRTAFMHENLTGFESSASTVCFRIAKYNASGDLKWSVMPNFVSIPGDYIHSTINSLTTDPLGNVYFAGNFRGNTLKIGNVIASFASASSHPYTQAYLAKLDSNGVCQWIIPFRSNISSVPTTIGDISYDHDGAIYFQVTGGTSYNFTDVLHNNPNPSNHNLIKIDSYGNLRHIRSINVENNVPLLVSWIDAYSPETGEIFSTDHKTIKYKDKIIHITPSRENSITLNNTQVITKGSADFYTYAIITDTIGNIISSFKPISLIGINYMYHNWKYVPHFTMDKDGYLYITWNYTTFLPEQYNYNNRPYVIALADGTTINVSDQTSILVKYDLSGNVIWYKQHRYFNTNSLVANNNGTISGLGEAYTLASFESNDGNDQLITFNDSCLHSLLYTYDSNGNFLWGKPFNGIYNEYPKELCLRDTCNSELYFTISFDSTANFIGTNVSSSNQYSIFKISEQGVCQSSYCGNNPIGISEALPPYYYSDLFYAFPNPNAGTFTIYPLHNEKINVRVFDTFGKLVQEISISGDIKYTVNLSNQASGLYTIVSDNGSKVQAKKIVLIK